MIGIMDVALTLNTLQFLKQKGALLRVRVCIP